MKLRHAFGGAENLSRAGPVFAPMAAARGDDPPTEICRGFQTKTGEPALLDSGKTLVKHHQKSGRATPGARTGSLT